MTSLASDPEKVSPTAAFDKEEIASQRSERQPSLTFSEKSWKTILASCMPMAFICLLVWLDEAILATAIPRISDEFNSFDQIGWYGPSYLFGLCASQLPFGRAYKDFPSKITYLVSLGIFEIASIVQATAQSSPAFIVGRVLAGIGGSAVLTGSLTIFSEEVPKAKLPYIMGGFGWAHGVGGIAGPIIGGAITSSPLTWRWWAYSVPCVSVCKLTLCRCFYLNPIASVVAMVPVLILWRGHFTLELKDRNASLAKVLARVDYLGILVFIAAVVMLLLGFQFGGSSYSWSDKRTVASLTVAGALALIFSAIQWWKGSNALVPKNILGMRVVLLSSLYSAALDGAYFILAYQVRKISSPSVLRVLIYLHRSLFGSRLFLVSQLATQATAFCHFWHRVSSSPQLALSSQEDFSTTSPSCYLELCCLQLGVAC
jgi:MFS family permease